MRLTELINTDNALNCTGALVTLVVGLLSIYIVFDEGSTWIVVGLLSTAHLVAFLVFISDWADRYQSRMKILLWIEAGLITLLYFLVNSSFIAILSIVWIVQAAELYSARIANRLLVAAVLTFTLSQVYHLYPEDMLSAFVSSVTLGLFHVFALTATRRAINEQELREQTATLNRELLATRDLLSQSTRQSERLRIARELHDLLGHHMTALILNLEVAAHHSDGPAREKVEQSQSLAKLLLSDLRTAVSELRDEDSIKLEQSIHKLVADIPRINFNIDFSQAPAIKDVEQAETLLRCIQESITNVMKHSNADNCLIQLTGTEQECELVVSDNGQPSGGINPGNGLKGMGERVSVSGGRLTWQQAPTGFSLHIQLPGASS